MRSVYVFDKKTDMRTQTFLLGIILTIASPLLIFGCGNNLQKSDLPKEMPADTEMNYNENGGMSPFYKSIKISGKQLSIEEVTPEVREKKTFTVEISDADKNELYQTFVANKFDLIKNDERGEIVYDAGSRGISIFYNNKSFGVSSGDNSPLSGENSKRWSNVCAAFTKLEAKYKDKLIEKIQNYAIIKYERKSHDFVFKNVKSSNLDDSEIEKLENITSEAVEKYNLKQNEYGKIKDLSEYKFQYIPVYNSKREKEVWVNAFCSDFKIDWKKQIVAVDDGGSCYFNLKINLTNSNVYDFWVNGEA